MYICRSCFNNPGNLQKEKKNWQNKHEFFNQMRHHARSEYTRKLVLGAYSNKISLSPSNTWNQSSLKRKNKKILLINNTKHIFIRVELWVECFNKRKKNMWAKKYTRVCGTKRVYMFEYRSSAMRLKILVKHFGSSGERGNFAAFERTCSLQCILVLRSVFSLLFCDKLIFY